MFTGGRVLYLQQQTGPDQLEWVTHPRARRGRGVLFATAPFVLYLLTLSVLFVVSLRDLYLWEKVKQFAAWGALLTGILVAIAFLLGRRIQERLLATSEELRVERTRAIGRAPPLIVSRSRLRAFATFPSMRSLGADLQIHALCTDDTRIPLLEADPHSGQAHDIAAQLADLMGLAVERHREE